MMAHPAEALEHDRHALAGPQVAVESVRQRALQQRLLKLAASAGIQLGSPAGAAGGAQRNAATLLPLAVPAVGVLAGGAEPVGDLGLAGALFEHTDGTQS
jgi:hypothetical protein